MERDGGMPQPDELPADPGNEAQDEPPHGGSLKPQSGDQSHWGWLQVALLLAAVWWAVRGLHFDWSRIRARAGDNMVTLARDLWPPDWTPAFRDQAAHGLVETLQISVLATVIGFVLSLPVALLAARNLMPPAVAAPFRALAAAIRVPPSLLWAIFAVLVLGLGPVAGVVAMGLYSAGYLAKLQYEAFEGLPLDALEAVRAMGANRFQVAWHVVLPEAQNTLRSQALFMFEYNVRASSIIGIVGAGGIGQVLQTNLAFYDYGRVMTILLMMLLTVMLIDAASGFVRRRYLEEGHRATWRDLLRR